MAANKITRWGPVALSSTLTTNILNPHTLSGGTGMNTLDANTYIVIRHVRIVNKTAGAVTCSFWLGASAGNVAGTEVIGQGLSVPANSYIDWFGLLRLTATGSGTGDFLVGGASAATSLSFEAEGEIGVA